MNDIQITERIRAAYMLNTPTLKKEIRQRLYPARNIPPGNVICRICSDLANLLPLIQCATCGYWYHCDCLKIPQSYLARPSETISNGKWNCESCYDYNVDPFNKVEQVLGRFKIDRNIVTTTVKFSLSEHTLQKIMKEKYNVILRLYDIFNGNDKIDYENMAIIINNLGIKITETRLYRFLQCGKNTLCFIFKKIPENVIYCGSILSTKSYRASQLVQFIRTDKYIPLANSIKFVKNFFKNSSNNNNSNNDDDDDDDETNIIHLDVSTHCPFSLKRIETPVRGLYCNHIQCFDLYSYLSMNNMDSKWNCPVCNHFCPFSQLIVDPFYDQILKSDGEIIRIKPDATWVVQQQEYKDDDEEREEGEEGDDDYVKKEKRKIEVIDIIDDDDDEENMNNNHPPKIAKL